MDRTDTAKTQMKAEEKLNIIMRNEQKEKQRIKQMILKKIEVKERLSHIKIFRCPLNGEPNKENIYIYFSLQ